MKPFYHRELSNLKFEKSVFTEIEKFALHSVSWCPGVDRNGLRWNVRELPLSVDEFPILREIFDGLQCEFKRPSFFVSQVLPGGLVNHIDHRKWANLAFPLSGPFESSPTLFLDVFNHVIESFYFQPRSDGTFSPFILNTRAIHAVPLEINENRPRLVLMMDLFDWPDHLFEKVDQNTIWMNTPRFQYQSRPTD